MGLVHRCLAMAILLVRGVLFVFGFLKCWLEIWGGLGGVCVLSEWYPTKPWRVVEGETFEQPLSKDGCTAYRFHFQSSRWLGNACSSTGVSRWARRGVGSESRSVIPKKKTKKKKKGEELGRGNERKKVERLI